MASFRNLLFAAFAVLWLGSSAQIDISDSSVVVPMFSVAFGYQVPAGDIAERYGNNATIGGDFKVKTSGNWVFGVDFNYIFGEDIKNRDERLSIIRTDLGEIIDGEGVYASWQMFERGFYSTFRVGKIFPVIGPNPNSGIIFMAGPGYMQHKTRIEVEFNTAPQLKGDYKRGYDKLTGGFTAAAFLGYIHMSNSKIVNFYVGLEFVQAWTQDYREYNFNEMQYTNGQYSDNLFGLKAGWFLPLHKRAPRDFYYK